jgi:hypothetical protein
MQCLACQTYVTPGATDCASCGLVLAREDPVGTVRQGALLNGLLIVSAFGNVVALIATAVHFFSAAPGRTFLQIVDGAISLVAFLASLVALWAIWKWQKWGVYLYLSISTAFLVVSAIAGLLTVRSLIAIAVLAGLALAVRKQWEHFR